MKMPEKHDLLAAILMAKEQNIRAILAFTMAYLRESRYQWRCVYKNGNRRNDVALVLYRLDSFVTFSTSPDW